MTARLDAPKSKPEDLVAQVLQAVLNNEEEVLTDDVARKVKASLSTAKPACLGL
jgi:predicted transcriptional regulator